MGTVRLERRIDNQRLENSQLEDETMLSTKVASSGEDVNMISDDESDFTGPSTSRTFHRPSHVAAHHDDSTVAAVCDSCQFCNDVCDIPNCVECQSKTSNFSRNGNHQQRFYTMCQIRRHNSIENSVWIIADDTVYDVTSYIQYHPGGMECIMKKAGGKHNCRRDLQFHSQRGQQLFNKYAIGKVRSCPGCASVPTSHANATTSRPSMIAALEKHRWFLW